MRAPTLSKVLASSLLASVLAVALASCERQDTSPGFDDTDPIEPAPQAPPVTPPPAPGQPGGGLPDAQ